MYQHLNQMLVNQHLKICEAASFILDILVGKCRRHDMTCIYVVRQVKIVEGWDKAHPELLLRWAVSAFPPWHSWLKDKYYNWSICVRINLLVNLLDNQQWHSFFVSITCLTSVSSFFIMLKRGIQFILVYAPSDP